MSEAIVFHNVSKRYQDTDKDVLHNVNFRVFDGEVVGVVGQSGSGKSTLLHLAGLVDQPTSGNIHLLGRTISEMNAHQLNMLRRKELGFLFQQDCLFAELSVFENVVFPLRILRQKIIFEQISTLLHKVGIPSGFFHRKPYTLSGGEKQRVALVRSIVHIPRILFCDEPTGKLDPKMRDEINQLILHFSLQFNITVLIVTHDLNIQKSIKKIFTIESSNLSMQERRM